MQVEATTPTCILPRSMVLTGHANYFPPRRSDHQPVLGFCSLVLRFRRNYRWQNGSRRRCDDHGSKRRFSSSWRVRKLGTNPYSRHGHRPMPSIGLLLACPAQPKFLAYLGHRFPFDFGNIASSDLLQRRSPADALLRIWGILVVAGDAHHGDRYRFGPRAISSGVLNRLQPAGHNRSSLTVQQSLDHGINDIAIGCSLTMVDAGELAARTYAVQRYLVSGWGH